jgi:hypothetical protein
MSINSNILMYIKMERDHKSNELTEESARESARESVREFARESVREFARESVRESKESSNKSKTIHIKRRYGKIIDRRLRRLRKWLLMFDETDDMAEIINSIIDMYILMKIYNDNIRYITENEDKIIDQTCIELEVADKLDTLRFKADTVYLFTTVYMKKNLSRITKKLSKVIKEYEDLIEVKNKEKIIYHIPILNEYLYKKEKKELINAINRVEKLYIKKMRMNIDLLEEVDNIIQELDGYYGIQNYECC